MPRFARSLVPAVLLCALAVAAPAGAGVQVGSAAWQWGNPLPQGNTVRSLAFFAGSGYAVGDFGTVLATDDGGATWRGLVSGTLQNLGEVQAIDKDSLFAGGGCVARRSDDGGRTFQRVAFTPVETNCRQPLAASWFATEQIGYIVLADGTTIRTDNNGQSFASRTPLPGTGAAGGSAAPTDIVFTGPDTGLAATTGGKVYRTTDGANTWTLAVEYNRTTKAFALAGATVIAAGDQGLLRSSNDGGVTWSGVDKASTTANLSGVSCASADLCVLTTAAGNGQPGNDLIRFDAALTPSTSQVTPSGSPIAAAAFASATSVVAAGTAGVTAISADTGKTFTPVGSKLTGAFSGVVAGAAKTAFAYGDNGAIAKSVNGGQAWSAASVPTSELLSGVSFPTPGAGFALDVSGGMFATADGGATWRTLDIGTTATPRSVLAPTATTVLVAGPRSVRRSVDGGTSFTAAGGKIAKKSVSQLDAGGSAIFAWGGDSLWRTTDKGRTWTSVKFPTRLIKLRNGKKRNAFFIDLVDFVNAKTGYLEGDNGRVFRTANAGRSWTELFSVGTANLTDLAFGSASKGYLVSRDGRGPSTILRTTDNGATWAPQVVVSDAIARGGIATGPDATDYLLAGSTNLLFTTTGGATGSRSTLTITTPKTKLKKAASINVTGKLTPAQAGRVVTVAFLPAGSRAWQRTTVKTASTGSFTTSFKARKGTNRFVAQWPGDELRAGDGTTVLTVTAKK